MATGTSKKKALALKYDSEKHTAPHLSAKGEGLIADKIIAIAKEAGIPIKEDSDLTEILYGLELNQEIPPETYLVVAEILSWVYRVNKQKKG